MQLKSSCLKPKVDKRSTEFACFNNAFLFLALRANGAVTMVAFPLV